MQLLSVSQRVSQCWFTQYWGYPQQRTFSHRQGVRYNSSTTFWFEDKWNSSSLHRKNLTSIGTPVILSALGGGTCSNSFAMGKKYPAT